MRKFIVPMLLSAAIPLCAQNLLENSSFETVNEQKNVPASWSVVKRGIIDNTHSSETAAALDGKTSAKIVNNTGITKGISLLYLQSLRNKLNAVPAGTKMELSVYARAVSGNARIRVYLEAPAAKKLHLRDMNVTADKWRKLTIPFTKVDANYGSPYVCLGLLQGQNVIFDCAYLGPEGKNPYASISTVSDLVYNGGFEQVKGNMPANWKVLDAAKCGGKAEVVSENAASGNNCAKLSSPVRPKKFFMLNYNFDAADMAAIAPGTEMEVTFKAKTDTPAAIFRCYTEFMAKGKFVGTNISPNMKCTKGWEEKKFTFKMPKVTPNGGNLYLQLMTEGEVMFDNVSVKVKK